MRKLATAIAVSLALAAPGVQALGLGDIEMHSALNQPLDAEILLNSVQPGELEGLLVQLASPEAFERAGIERSNALMALNFSVDRKGDGTPYIKVGSNGPVVEPFLNFLLEVDWPKGRMVREYTVLLDPPVFMTQDAVSSADTTVAPESVSQEAAEQDLIVPVAIDRVDGEAQPVEIMVAENAETESLEQESELVIDSPAPEQNVNTAPLEAAPAGTDSDPEYFLDGVRTSGSEVPVAQTLQSEQTVAQNVVPDVVVMGDETETGNDAVVAESAPSYSGEGDSYTVIRNDTLWEIASEARPANVSVQQMMLALLRINESAFVENNVNRLKAGAILRMPAADEINSLNRREAVAEMKVQNRLWQEYRDSIRRVAGSTDGTAIQTQTQTQTATATVPSPGGDSESALSESPSAPMTSSSDTTTTADANESPVADTSTASGSQASDTAAADPSAGPSDTTAATETETPSAELKIVADPAATDSAATANADETERPDTELIGQINTNLALAQEELEAETLRKEELQSQATELQSNTEKMERLIELRENEMAQLQDRLAAAGTTANAPAEQAQAALSQGEDSAQDTGTSAQTDEAPSDAATLVQTDTTSDAAAVTSADATAADESPVLAPPVQEKTFVQSLMDNPAQAAGIGLGALGLLGGLGWLLTRGRRKEEDEIVFEAEEEFLEDEQEQIAAEFDAHEPVVDEAEATQPVQVVVAEDASEEEVLDEIQDFDDTDQDALDDTDLLAASVDDESSKDDTISEADVYLAYGLHGQAEDLLNKAVERDPENPEYYLKLMETHHSQKNVDGFNQIAQNFQSRFGGEANPQWQRVAELGREIDPTNELYQSDNVSGGGMAAGAVAAVGLGAAGAGAFSSSDDEEEIDNTISFDDFSATGEVTEVISPPGEVEADTDLAAVTEPEEESLLDQSIDPGLAFDEADLEATGDFSKIAEEINDEISDQPVEEAAPEIAEISEGIEGISSELEDIQAANIETSTAELEEVLDTDLDAAMELSLDADDDLLASVESDVNRAGDENPDLGAMLDEVASGEEKSGGNVHVLTPAKSDSSVDAESNIGLSALEDTGLDFEESVLDLSSLKDDEVGSGTLDNLDLPDSPEELTLDLEQLSDGPAVASEAGDNIENLFENTETLDSAFDQTQELEIPDLTASTDLTGTDDSIAFGNTNEMETMLDLAKAYIDMGDKESASSALDEIIKGGSKEQIESAEQLLKKIG